MNYPQLTGTGTLTKKKKNKASATSRSESSKPFRPSESVVAGVVGDARCARDACVVFDALARRVSCRRRLRRRRRRYRLSWSCQHATHETTY